MFKLKILNIKLLNIKLLHAYYDPTTLKQALLLPNSGEQTLPGVGVDRSSCSIGTAFYLQGDENAFATDSGDAHTTL